MREGTATTSDDSTEGPLPEKENQLQGKLPSAETALEKYQPRAEGDHCEVKYPQQGKMTPSGGPPVPPRSVLVSVDLATDDGNVFWEISRGR